MVELTMLIDQVPEKLVPFVVLIISNFVTFTLFFICISDGQSYSRFLNVITFYLTMALMVWICHQVYKRLQPITGITVQWLAGAIVFLATSIVAWTSDGHKSLYFELFNLLNILAAVGTIYRLLKIEPVIQPDELYVEISDYFTDRQKG